MEWSLFHHTLEMVRTALDDGDIAGALSTLAAHRSTFEQDVQESIADMETTIADDLEGYLVAVKVADELLDDLYHHRVAAEEIDKTAKQVSEHLKAAQQNAKKVQEEAKRLSKLCAELM